MRRAFLGLAVVASLVVGGSALAASYSFTLIAETGTAPNVSFGTLDHSPSINDSGRVAYMTLTNTGTRQLRIFDGVTDVSALEAINIGDPDINSKGTTAFYAELSPTEVGIYKRTAAGVVSNVAAATPGGFSSFDLPSINDSGTVAFYAGTSSVGAGIFTGGDATTDAVIKAGDALFGSIVDDLAFSHFGLNNDGEIAFWAHLQDGRQVVARASLVQSSVPGPGLFTVFGLGLAGLAGLRRRSREGH